MPRRSTAIEFTERDGSHASAATLRNGSAGSFRGSNEYRLAPLSTT
jgi:hypothetical protein